MEMKKSRNDRILAEARKRTVENLSIPQQIQLKFQIEKKADKIILSKKK